MSKIGEHPWLKAGLYEPCQLCGGTGKPRPDARVMIDPPTPENIESVRKNCLCGGRGVLPIGMTVIQLERLKAENDRLKSLTKAALTMEHGVCEPRERQACTACNAADELRAIVRNWHGQTYKPSKATEPSRASRQRSRRHEDQE